MVFFSFNDTATTEIYTLSLHDALPIFVKDDPGDTLSWHSLPGSAVENAGKITFSDAWNAGTMVDIVISYQDRKSTRLNSSHGYISYAVFCLKKKKNRSR